VIVPNQKRFLARKIINVGRILVSRAKIFAMNSASPVWMVHVFPLQKRSMLIIHVMLITVTQPIQAINASTVAVMISVTGLKLGSGVLKIATVKTQTAIISVMKKITALEWQIVPI
jgi:hypothetical protein